MELLGHTLVFLSVICSKNVIYAEDQLDRNLKILRKDFNKFIENIEDFTSDVILQMRDAGKFIDNSMVTDYNWEDDQLNTIVKATKKPPILTSTNTETSEPTKYRNKDSFTIRTDLSENIEKNHLSNHIHQRDRRSAAPVSLNLEERPIAPTREETDQIPILDSDQGLPTPIAPETDPRMSPLVLQGNDEIPTSVLQISDDRPPSPFPEEIEQRSSAPIINNVSQRMASPPIFGLIPPFPRSNANFNGAHEENEKQLSSKQYLKEDSSQSTRYSPKKLSGEHTTCTSRTQNELEIEKEKMETFKREVQKMNEVVSLLKEQQKIIKEFINENNGESIYDNDVNVKDNIENTFLYKAIKHLENNKKNIKESPQAVSKELESRIQSKTTSMDDLKSLKLDLRNTAENLNKTKQVLIQEKLKEESLEQELRKQRSELKFMKVMMESLYDKVGVSNEENKKIYKNKDDEKKINNSNIKVDDFDSILEATHTPKTMPVTEKYLKTAPDSYHTTPLQRVDQKLRGSSLLRERDELSEQFDQRFNKWINSPSVQDSIKTNLMLERAKQTEAALINLAKNDPNRFKMIHKKSTMRKSIDDQPDLISFSNAYDDEQNANINHTILNQKDDNLGARSSNSDLDLKLKLLETLTSKGKSDDIGGNEKSLSTALKKLIEPETRSDDINILLSLIKEKRDESSSEKRLEEILKRFLKQLNDKPQKKNDDDVEDELRQLQKAINSLRPKEDKILDNLDLHITDSHGKGKQENEFQSILNQMIAQNGASGQGSLDLGSGTTGTTTNFDASTTESIKLTPQQLLQISKIMSSNNNKPLSVSSYNPTGSISQQLLNQYISSSIPSPYGNSNQHNVLKELTQTFGSSQYGDNPSYYESGIPIAYPNIYSSLGNPKMYFSDTIPAPTTNSYASNFISHEPKSYNTYNAANDFGSQDSAPYYFGPGNIPSLPNSYTSEHVPHANKFPPYSYQQGYRFKPAFPKSISPNYGNSGNTYSGLESNNALPLPLPVSNELKYPVLKNFYQSSLSTTNNQPSTIYQSPIHDFYGGNKNYQIPFKTAVQANGFNSQQGYGKPFFLSSGASNIYGGDNQGSNYKPKSFNGPSVDKSLNIGQNNEKYKYSMAEDVTQQIESLERAISGLTRSDYSTPEDKAAVLALEQRIYELKGVINSLHTPNYNSQPSYYASQISYGLNQANPQYSQASHQSESSNTSPYKEEPISVDSSNVYPSSNGHTSSANQNSYSTSAVASQSYAAGSPSGIVYPPSQSLNVPLSPASSSSYPPPPQSVNYNSGQLDNPPPVYQPTAQIDPNSSSSYPPTQLIDGSSYQPKLASVEDTTIINERKKIHRYEGKETVERRRKRQVDGVMASTEKFQIPMEITPREQTQMHAEGIPQLQQQETVLPQKIDDIQSNSKQSYQNSENKLNNIPDDALAQIAYTFKRYLEENLTDSNPSDVSVDARNSAVDNLQEKLDSLKKQLELHQPFGRSLNKIFGSPGIVSNLPSGSPYGTNYNFLDNFKKGPVITSLEKPVNDKVQDVFTQVILKILDKVLGALPSVLNRLFGDLFTSIGGSYGDGYSSLQNVFSNLGAVGYIPLILVKLLEASGAIIQYLGKNKFFKGFLLPGVAVAAAGLGILFLVYFYQQNEPYGYITNQSHDYAEKYPHNSNTYGGYDHYTGTRYENYRPYEFSDSYRSNNGEPYGFHDKIMFNNDNSRMYDTRYENKIFKPNPESFGNAVPYTNIAHSQYIRPFFGNRVVGRNFDSFSGEVDKAPLQMYRGYYDYFSEQPKITNNKLVDR